MKKGVQGDVEAKEIFSQESLVFFLSGPLKKSNSMFTKPLSPKDMLKYSSLIYYSLAHSVMYTYMMYMCVCMYIYVCVYMHVYMYIYVYIYK